MSAAIKVKKYKTKIKEYGVILVDVIDVNDNHYQARFNPKDDGTYYLIRNEVCGIKKSGVRPFYKQYRKLNAYIRATMQTALMLTKSTNQEISWEF